MDPLWGSKKISTKLTKNGFPWATCHTFRHTFRHTYISHLMMSGVSLTTVKEIVRHSSYNTTLKYAHLAPGHKNDMAQKRPIKARAVFNTKKGFTEFIINPLFTVPGTGLEPVRRLSSEGF